MLPPAGATESTHAHVWFLGFIKNERCVTLLLKQQERETKEKKGGIFTSEEEKEKSKGRRAESSGRPLPPSEGVGPLVRHHAVDLVDGGGEGAQAHLLRPVDDLRARLRPLLGHLQVLVGVDQEVEGTWAEGTVVQVTAFAGRTGGGEELWELTGRLQQRQEGDGGRDLPDDGADLVLDGLDGLLPGGAGDDTAAESVPADARPPPPLHSRVGSVHRAQPHPKTPSLPSPPTTPRSGGKNPF